MAKRRFELVEGTSSKFWEISVEGDTVTVTFGKIGTAGSSKDKTHPSADDAAREAAKLVAEKTKKGYSEVGAGAAAAAPTKSPEAAPPKAPKTTKPVATAAAASAPSAGAPSGPLVDAFFDALAKKHKPLVKALRPAASEEALTTLRELSVPAAFLALYARHDGCSAELYGSYRWISVDEIVSQRKMMNGILAERADWRDSRRWMAGWVPFLSDGDGQFYCYDPIGGTDGGPAGQIVGFDHESGPARSFASFDVVLELLGSLAKKGFLGETGREENEEAFEELVAKAQAVGLAKMNPKELKKVLSSIDSSRIPPEKKIAVVLPLAKQYGAERELWQAVGSAAQDLGDWKLMLQATTAVDKLTAKRDRPHWESMLSLALHKCGRDEDALSVLRGALRTKTNYPESQIPHDASPEFLRRAYALATEERPKNYDLWLSRGQRAIDPAERKSCFEKVIALSKDKDITPYNEDRKKTAGYTAARQIEIDRIETLAPAERHEALLALSKKKGELEIADTWQRLAESALERRDWATLATAGEKREACESMDYKKYAYAHFRVRALYELGKGKAALAHLEKHVLAMYDFGEDDAMDALPFGHPVERPADVALDDAQKAFELEALRVLTKRPTPKAAVWFQLALAATDASERRAAYERVVAMADDPEAKFEPDPTCTAEYNERGLRQYEELRALRGAAVKALAK
jgi:predicted DNA-binding WGR domain protein/cell wall assembly regulator SMI1